MAGPQCECEIWHYDNPPAEIPKRIGRKKEQENFQELLFDLENRSHDYLNCLLPI